VDYFHRSTAQYIAGTYQQRISQEIGYILRFIEGSNRSSGRLRYAKIIQECLEPVPVFSDVDAFIGRTQDRHTIACENVGKVDSRLPSELHN
jgi:hypothetical protein